MNHDCRSIRLVLTDADIVTKLSRWELFSHLPMVLRCSWGDIATLSSLVHRAERAMSKPDSLFTSCATATFAFNSLRLMRKLPAPDAHIIELLQDSPQIDAGEILLIGAACAVPNARLATGDKRALLQLSRCRYGSVATAIAGRVVCLEQLILAYIDRLGIEPTRVGVAKSRDADKAISNCFGFHNDASEASVREGLGSYIELLRQETGALLVGTRDEAMLNTSTDYAGTT